MTNIEDNMRTFKTHKKTRKEKMKQKQRLTKVDDILLMGVKGNKVFDFKISKINKFWLV